MSEKSERYNYYTKEKVLSIHDPSLINKQFLSQFKNPLSFWASGLNLTDIPDLRSFNNLEEIDLSHNRINSLKNLERLGNFQSIQKISMSYNKLADLCGFKSVSRFKELRLLHLGHNQITKLNITRDVPKLRELNLSNNQIQHITVVKNLSCLETLNLMNNKIIKLENIQNLPALKYIQIDDNPIASIEGLISKIETLPQLSKISSLKLINFSRPREKVRNWNKGLFDYNLHFGLYFDFEEEYEDGFIDEDTEGFIRKFDTSLKRRINQYITIHHDTRYKEEKNFVVAIDGEPVLNCTYLLINITAEHLTTTSEIESIDQAAEFLDHILEDPLAHIEITEEEEFWAHCSNLQAWVEHNYDTRIIHRTVAFPLLKKLTDAGDLLARKVFKEEIASRYESGHPSVVEFLKQEGYLNYLSKEELNSIKVG